jgi:hypothetical protein
MSALTALVLNDWPGIVGAGVLLSIPGDNHHGCLVTFVTGEIGWQARKLKPNCIVGSERVRLFKIGCATLSPP